MTWPMKAGIWYTFFATDVVIFRVPWTWTTRSICTLSLLSVLHWLCTFSPYIGWSPKTWIEHLPFLHLWSWIERTIYAETQDYGQKKERTAKFVQMLQLWWTMTWVATERYAAYGKMSQLTRSFLQTVHDDEDIKSLWSGWDEPCCGRNSTRFRVAAGNDIPGRTSIACPTWVRNAH